MKKLFKPRSIAIVGASNTKDKIGNILATNLIEYGYEGEVYFVNPSSEEILGQKAYASLSAIGTDVDVAIVAIPAKFVEDVLKDGAENCKHYVIISAGFGESGVDGHNKEMALSSLAEDKGLTVVGPNCLGFISPGLHLNASFAPGMPAEGPVAFISQSGALAVALVDRAQEFSIGFSSVISIGNKMQVDSAALIDYFADDDATTVIALYLEGIKDGHAFLDAARRARRKGKHIIVLKSGRTAQAQNAIALHTGSLAGDDAIIDVACEKVGITRVDSIAALFATVRVAIATPLAHLDREASRVAVLTNAGGPGVVSTDAIGSARNIVLAEFSEIFKKDLAKKLPAAASVHNPIDLLGDADLVRYRDGLEACMHSDDVDVIFILLTPQKNTPVIDVAHAAIEAHKKGTKSIIVSFIGGASISKAREEMHGAGVLYFDAPDAAIRAFDRLSRIVPEESRDMRVDTSRQKETAFLRAALLKAKRTATYFSEARSFVSLYNIPVSTFWDVTDSAQVPDDVDYPVVAKVDNPTILHKSDRGGVILPLNSPEDLLSARTKLLNDFPEDGTKIIVQSLLEIQMELIVGIKKDATFGSVVVVGIGGIYTEFLQKSQIFLPPLARSEIVQMLTEGPLGFFLNGVRGQKSYDLEEVASVIWNMLALARENPEVTALDINPLLIYNDGRKASAVDVKIIF